MGATSEREDAFLRVVRLYGRVLGPETVLAAPEIGVLGFFTNAQILDTAGLISPQALDYYPLRADQYATNYAVPPELILDVQPDYLVSMEWFIERSLLTDPGFVATYREIDRIPAEIYNGTDILVFRRVDGD